MALIWLLVGFYFSLGFSVRINHVGPQNGVNASSTVYLGGLFPIQRTTGLFNYGFEMAMGMVYAVETINQNEEILPNISLGFDIHDTFGRVNMALEESLAFISQQCGGTAIGANGTERYFSGVVGTTSSSVSIPVASLLRLFGLPQISTASTAESLSNKEEFEFFYRTVPPDSGQVQVMYNLVKLFNWTYVSIIYTADVYGESGFKGLQKVFEEDNSSNICIANSIPLSTGIGELEYDGAVNRLMENYRKNATVVILFAQEETAIGVTQAWQRRQPKTPGDELTWIASDGAARDLPWARGMLGVYPRSQRSVEFNTWFKQIGESSTAGSPWVSEYLDGMFGCVRYSNGTSQGDCDHENVTIGDIANYEPTIFVPPTIDAVYAFAHALHNMTAEMCNYTLCDAILETASSLKINVICFANTLEECNFLVYRKRQ